MERTLSIIKPNAVKKSVMGKIIDRFESKGLKVVAAKFKKLSDEEAKGFYQEHEKRPFFGSLVKFMTSGPVLLMVLEGKDAVTKNREIMGATNPEQAAPGTIRKDFADNIEANAVHGSDSAQSAAREISYWFEKNEIWSH